MQEKKKVKRHGEIIAALAEAKKESDRVEVALFIALEANIENYEKIGLLCSKLSKKSIRQYCDIMEGALLRLRDGEKPKDIIADLEKLVAEAEGNQTPRNE